MSIFGTVERFGGSDDSWLGSRDGVDVAKSGTLNAEAFSDYEGGVVPSGTPVARDGDRLKPSAGGSDADFEGFVIGDHSVAKGDRSVPVLWRGRVHVDRLPTTFTPVDGTLFRFEGADSGEGA